MSEKIGCLQLSDAIDIGEAAKIFDNKICFNLGCPHHCTCMVLNQQIGGGYDTRRDSQRTP